MTSFAGLPAIITAARAGALHHAERLFTQYGYDRRTDDPAALAVQGRLLKDRAARLSGAERQETFANAAAAYAAADALAPKPYTRINVATLTMLAGDADEACRIARQLIGWIESDEAIRETPYYLSATKAEAHVLCGNMEGARRAMREAVERSPLAFEDRASTLRQLELIVEARREDRRWLDEFRPPRTLHFAGHLGIRTDPGPDLLAQIDDVLEGENVGFAFGALAAGADLVIAERLLRRGAELHVVLPLASPAFLEQSVAPYGDEWVAKFEDCRTAAASWTETASDTGEYEPLATDLAADVAMGAAVRHARHIEGEALQLVIADTGPGRFGDGKQTARDAGRWSDTGRTCHVIRAEREVPVIASGRRAPEGRPDRRLAALLHIAFAGLEELDEVSFGRAVDEQLLPMRQLMAGAPSQPDVVLPSGNSRIVAFEVPEAAFDFGRYLLALPGERLPVRIAGHYGLTHWLRDPDALVGRSVAELAEIASATLPGTLTVSESFASALFLSLPPGIYAEPLGERGSLRLYAMRGEADQ